MAKTKWTRIAARYELHRRALSNPLSRRRFHAHQPRLDDLQRQLVTDLKERGIATARFEDLVGDDGLWEAMKADIEAFGSEAAATAARDIAQPEGKRDYYLSRWAARHARAGSAERRVSIEDPWLAFGLSDRVLDVVNAYRGLWTRLIDIDNVYTVPFPEAQRRVGAQNWHRDPEDLHVVKVFLYFSDVDDEAGPFEYIQGSAAGGPYGHLWPWRVRGGVYPPTDELEPCLSPGDRIAMKGPAGTIVFCDTSGLHRGGFARSKPRTLSNHAYVSPASVAAGRTQPHVVANGGGDGAQLSDAARFALARADAS